MKHRLILECDVSRPVRWADDTTPLTEAQVHAVYDIVSYIRDFGTVVSLTVEPVEGATFTILPEAES